MPLPFAMHSSGNTSCSAFGSRCSGARRILLEQSLSAIGFLLFLCAAPLSAQTGDTIFYNWNWKKCSRDVALYYGLEELDSLGNGSGRYYYITGELQSTDEYRNGLRHGTSTWWYRNGQKSAVGSYRSGLRNGRSEFWHENGVKSAEGMYRNDEVVGEWMRWDKEGRRYYDANYSITDPVWGEQTDFAESLELLGDIVMDDLDYPLNIRLLPTGSYFSNDLPEMPLTVIIYDDGKLKVIESDDTLPAAVTADIVTSLEYLEGWIPAEKEGEKVNVRLRITIILEEV